MRLLPLACGGFLAAVALAVPQVAHAQGNGRPKTGRPSTETTAAATATPLTTYPQFGAWLDDASALGKGDGAVSIGAGFWRLDGMTQSNIPMLGGGIGITDRMQVSASVPFYRVSAPTFSSQGLDDVYLSAKYTLLDPTLTVSEVGLAISPVVEVLSADASDGRVHFALPVSVELRRMPFRVYGSAGYFTRGAMFGGGAVEWTGASGVSLTGAIMQSYSTRLPTVTTTAMERSHADVTFGIAAPVARAASVYGSVGRSLTSVESGGASLAVTGGLSFRVR
jgi:hypothetical protein